MRSYPKERSEQERHNEGQHALHGLSENSPVPHFIILMRYTRAHGVVHDPAQPSTTYVK